jgi:hypothetical protein
VAYNFQTRNNKIKLLTEYENVTQTLLYIIESILQIVEQLQHARLYFVDVFTVLLLSTGHGADHIEKKSHDSYLASPLAH